MLSRRRFLTFSATGMLAATAGCRPQHLDLLLNLEGSTTSAELSLAEKAKLKRFKDLMLGYPVNMNTPPEDFFAWRRQLQDAGIGMFPYNNVGNPFQASPFPFNTHDFERELIRNFGKVYAFPPDDTWGFLSHSGTDSNMHGMYMGRTLLKARTGMIPKAYFTCEAHYSVQILRDLLGLETVFVDTLPDGAMDPADLESKLAANPDYPALVVATIGTTFKGAIDPLDQIRQKLENHPNYLHLDAALFGGYLPHTDRANEVLQQTADSSARYDSIAVSCHKFFGFTSPAGLFISRQSLFDEFNELFSRIHNPEYIHHVPGTITCSRDGVKPAEFYFYSTPSALTKQAEDAGNMLRNTTYLMEQMQRHLPPLQPIRANEASNTIYFRKPADNIVRKYSLATMHLNSEQGKQEYAHALVMPHVDRHIIDEFLTDLEHDLSSGS
ncbi:pyridoxal-dependent decarboxylase [Methylomarinum vadi]|uniref:pyridoxal-dependent decarboxylase n=1 Tax=Methylomarinum vadi TaxID=438855 RepID=UPI0004DF7E60|nr:pyridoxal-dependent decarboxylase [Methylomarinum vadi]